MILILRYIIMILKKRVRYYDIKKRVRYYDITNSASIILISSTESIEERRILKSIRNNYPGQPEKRLREFSIPGSCRI